MQASTEPSTLNEHQSSTLFESSGESGSQSQPFEKNPTKKSSLDVPQRIERKLAQYNASQSTFKRWLFEIVSWTVSATSMGAIIGILVYLRDQPLGKWPLGLTINTVLAKVASAALILPISEAIGQLKWTWFSKNSKEMFDFEIFDKASRGPWGSIMLLFRTKGKSLAALGALLTLLLLAIDTFFQQVTELPERWTLYEANATIPRTVRYNPKYRAEIVDGYFGGIAEDLELQRAVRSFFYGNGTQSMMFGNSSRPDVPLSCPTSRCEWEPYESLGVCSACADLPVSDFLTYACLETRLDWVSNLTGIGTENTYPNGTACGYYLNLEANSTEAPILLSGYRVNSNDSTEKNSSNAFGEALIMRTLPLVAMDDRRRILGGSINFKDIFFPLLDTLIVSAIDGSPQSVYQKKLPRVQECMLSWCVQTIKSSYSFAKYEEEVIETIMNTTTGQPFPWKTVDRGIGMDYFFQSNISIYTSTTDRSTPGFGVEGDTFVNAVSILDEIFPAMMTTANSSAVPRIRTKLWKRDHSYERAVDYSPWLSPNNVTRHMERLATAMTNTVRSTTESNELIHGQAYALETYVQVRWEWLTFPLTLLLLCLIFLAATIYKTSSGSGGSQETRVWKTSAMPTLIYSLPKDMQKEFTSPDTWTEPSNQGAKKVRIKLHPNKGWRVSGHAYTPTTPNFQLDSAPPGRAQQ